MFEFVKENQDHATEAFDNVSLDTAITAEAHYTNEAEKELMVYDGAVAIAAQVARQMADGAEVSQEAADMATTALANLTLAMAADSAQDTVIALESQATAYAQMNFVAEGAIESIKKGFAAFMKMIGKAVFAVRKIISAIKKSIMGYDDKIKESSKALGDLKNIDFKKVDLDNKKWFGIKRKFAAFIAEENAAKAFKDEVYVNIEKWTKSSMATFEKNMKEHVKSHNKATVAEIVGGVNIVPKVTGPLSGTIEAYLKEDGAIVQFAKSSSITSDVSTVTRMDGSAISVLSMGLRNSELVTKYSREEFNPAYIESLENVSKDTKPSVKTLQGIASAMASFELKDGNKLLDAADEALSELDKEIEKSKDITSAKLIILQKKQRRIKNTVPATQAAVRDVTLGALSYVRNFASLISYFEGAYKAVAKEDDKK